MNKSLIKRMKEERFSRVSIDLFSGPGGLCTGFKWAGILPLVAVDFKMSAEFAQCATEEPNDLNRFYPRIKIN